MSPQSHRFQNVLERIAPAMRCTVGGVFIAMGISKAVQPVEFLKLVRHYDIIHEHHVLNLTTATLPWLEVFCGLLLLLGLAARGAATVLLILLIVFTSALLIRAQTIHAATGLSWCAIKFDCGCGAGEVLICRKLGENLLLMIFSGVLACLRRSRFSLRYSLFARGTMP